jgi:hypothetical protein
MHERPLAASVTSMVSAEGTGETSTGSKLEKHAYLKTGSSVSKLISKVTEKKT